MAIGDPSSAIRKLELSRLDKRAIARSGMATDTDVEQFSLYISSKLRTNVVDRLIDATIERTVEGASTLNVTLLDDDWEILNSGLLNQALDVQLDGAWFRFASLDINDSELILTFEDREIAVLRTYAKWKVARRSKTTRAEFIMNLIREVREFKISVVIPELHVVQPVEKYPGDIMGSDPYTGVSGGISRGESVAPVPNQAQTPGEHRAGNFPKNKGNILTVKGSQITQKQISNSNIIIATGQQMLTQKDNPPKLITCAIMTAIVESEIMALKDKAHGNKNADHESAGIFQQQPGWGSYEERMDAATSARLFYKAAIKVNATNPGLGYGDLCQKVQVSAFPDRYQNYRGEAGRIVTAAGVVNSTNDANNMNTNFGGGSNGANFVFWRGSIEDRHGVPVRKPENSWTCIQRLADDVDWRAFFVAGTFYYMSEEDLFKQQPVGIITRFTEGIRTFEGNYDRNKKSGQIRITAAVGRWTFIPGSVVVVREAGPLNGRWLVNDYSRSLFDDVADITLKKPRPKLPEPINDKIGTIPDSWFDSSKPLDPGIGTNIPSGNSKQLQQMVLNDTRITFTNPTKQKNDIATGQIDDRVLQFLLYCVQNGWPCQISALKSDHSKYTSEGNPSDHGAGRAVDICTYNESNPKTDAFMDFVALGQPITGFSQLIGPNPLKVIPLGIYDSKVLGEHKSHCHIGFFV